MFIFIFRFGISLKPHKSPLKQQKLNVSIFSNFHQNQMYAKRLFGLTCSEICKCSPNMLSLYDAFLWMPFCCCCWISCSKSVKCWYSCWAENPFHLRWIQSKQNNPLAQTKSFMSSHGMKKKPKYGRCHKMWIVSLDARNTVDISLNVKPAKNMLISSK